MRHENQRQKADCNPAFLDWILWWYQATVELTNRLLARIKLVGSHRSGSPLKFEVEASLVVGAPGPGLVPAGGDGAGLLGDGANCRGRRQWRGRGRYSGGWSSGCRRCRAGRGPRRCFSTAREGNQGMESTGAVAWYRGRRMSLAHRVRSCWHPGGDPLACEMACRRAAISAAMTALSADRRMRPAVEAET